MADIKNISQKTLQNLEKNNLDPTPKEYTKEFCKLLKNTSLPIGECRYLDDISSLIQTSLQPSISLSLGEELQSFCIKIGDSPSLIFEKSIQKEMEKFIQQRFEVDKKVVAQKTADIARLISLMNKYLNDAIDSNKGGSNNVNSIKKEIEAISHSNSTKEELKKLQTKLVQAAINIENEMDNVNINLQANKDKVTQLEDKVKQLEKELAETKLQNTKDHLTGTLVRRAYEEELHKIDSLYKRAEQNYAIVFFDIDHFKKVNDTYGHEAGDVILKTFASLLLKLTRETDIVGRYGGEEFVSIVRYKETSELEKYITRIKTVVTTNKFIYKDVKLHITFSAGIDLRANNDSAQDTVANADKLLYKAKTTGRNKIVCWDGREF